MNPEISLTDRPVDALSRNATLSQLAEVVQPVVRQAMAVLGKPTTDVLHGTPLGHPLHPVLTDVPVGAWTVVAVLDAIELVKGPEATAAASDSALAIGLLGATGAALSGWADWSDTKDEPRTLGMAHALLNGVGAVFYLASFGLRKAGRRKSGIALAMLGYGFAGAASYLGGELSYGLQLGVKHTAIPVEPEPGYAVVLPEADLPDDTLVRVDFAGVPVLLRRRGQTVDAVSAACTHRGAALDEGALEGDCVRCPWHGSLFRLTDGTIVEGPASFPLGRFTARINGGSIEVAAVS